MGTLVMFKFESLSVFMFIFYLLPCWVC